MLNALQMESVTAQRNKELTKKYNQKVSKPRSFETEMSHSVIVVNNSE